MKRSPTPPRALCRQTASWTISGNGAVDVITDSSDPNYNAGDRGQNYSWSAVAYGDWMYVGTCYSAMGNTLTLMQNILGDKFDKDVMEAA